ncbi:MAG: flavodoxin family protein [Coriobacteriales bacterium]|nr:flavodoxin family protein [Coriobacteriales bacterium]
MADTGPRLLFISGSPRTHTCEALIDLLEQGARSAGAQAERFVLSKKRISPCTGCEGCRKTGTCVLADAGSVQFVDDDYLELKALLEKVDAVALVSPLYFAGPPAQLKAVFDRFQPNWVQRYVLGYEVSVKRPAQLFVIGCGGDAHGYAPLAGIAKSALAVAGFTLEKVNNFIGFLAPCDVPDFPDEEDFDQYAQPQLVQLKRATAKQEAFVQHAIDAGSAFARYAAKKEQANALAEQLAALEAELAALNAEGDDVLAPDAVIMPPRAHSVSDDPAGDAKAGIDLDYRRLIKSGTPKPETEE